MARALETDPINQLEENLHCTVYIVQYISNFGENFFQFVWVFLKSIALGKIITSILILIQLTLVPMILEDP
jgi:hypothetical protein